jgi:ABC-type transport system involved in multi-copper enzyme maturation permease subunit
MRWGLGPVFTYDCLVNARRWQTYALRSAGVSALLFAMATVATSSPASTQNSWRAYAQLGQAYFIAMIGVELALVMLAAPAATAGAICLDRARGTLAHMLMTDLSDAEIVLGKLAARLLPVLGLVACTWPAMAISALLGGIDPVAVTLAFAIIVAVALVGCTLALALSVWAKRTHEVILVTYTVFIAALLVWPIWLLLSTTTKIGPVPRWTRLANPFYVAFAPYTDPGSLEIWDYLAFFGVTVAASAVLTLIAVWRTRPVACRGSSETSGRARVGRIGRVTRWLPGPSLDRNPLLWREWRRSRPTRGMTAVLTLLMGTTAFFCIAGAVDLWKAGVDTRPGVAFWVVTGICSYVLHVSFGLLMLAAIAPTSMAEERQRGSLDTLAATSLSTREIVMGKWMGTFRLVVVITIAPAVTALAMATARSTATSNIGPGLSPEYYRVLTPGARIFFVLIVVATILAHGALITSVGLALAVWVKRQSRAIALSVSSFVLITIAWPIFISLLVNVDLGQKLVSLSPSIFLVVSVNSLTTRHFTRQGGLLFAGTFWAVEVLVVALALLWLTVRTFDICFDRIADRKRQMSTLSAAVTILAAMIGAGSLVWAIDYWVEGVSPGLLGLTSAIGLTAYCCAIALGLVVIAVDSAVSARSPAIANENRCPASSGRGWVGAPFWRSFGLVVLLAVGPAVLALCLATAPRAPRYATMTATNTVGTTSIISYELVDPDVPYVGEVRLRERLSLAAILALTILVHGAASVAVGLVLANAQGWTRRDFAVAVGLAVSVFFLLPLGLLRLNVNQASNLVGWNFIMASNSLLSILVARTAFDVTEVVWSVLSADAFFAILALSLYWWASKIRRHQLGRSFQDALPVEIDLPDDRRPAVEPTLGTTR